MSNLLNIINEIQYGYLDKDNIIHKGNDNEWFSKYKLQSKEEILTNMVGNCFFSMFCFILLRRSPFITVMEFQLFVKNFYIAVSKL